MESIDKPLLPQQRNKKVVVVSDTDTDTDEEGYEDEDGDDSSKAGAGVVKEGVKEGGTGDDEDEGWSSEEMTADEVGFNLIHSIPVHFMDYSSIRLCRFLSSRS